MQLHEKIVYYRKKNGLSQEALAEKIGVSRQAVSKWETGDALPEITKLKALAQCFGVTVDFLVDDGLEEPPEYDAPVYEPVNRANIFDDALDTVEERAVPFIKKYAWVGGILLAFIGAMLLARGVIGIATTLGVAGQFGAAGMLGVAAPTLLGATLSAVFGLILPVALLAAGVIIFKKFKP